MLRLKSRQTELEKDHAEVVGKLKKKNAEELDGHVSHYEGKVELLEASQELKVKDLLRT